MIFEALYESSKKGELLLIEGGFCHFHIRRDKQLTIKEIISTKKGAGTILLNLLLEIAKEKGAISILAKCPSDLESNAWYRKKGFKLEGIECLPSGRNLKIWRLFIAEQEEISSIT